MGLPTSRVTTNQSQNIILYDYLVCAPRDVDDWPRGLASQIMSGGYSLFLAGHYQRREIAARYGVNLGLCLSTPFGRTHDYLQLPSGEYTGYQLWEPLKAAEEGYGYLHDDLLAHTSPATTVIYTGSVPTTMTMRDAGWKRFIDAGYGFVFDALDGHIVNETAILEDAKNHYARGGRIWAEANLHDVGLPMLAAVDLWTRVNRVAPADAPSGSAWWWRSTTLDEAYVPATAYAMMELGLQLFIRLGQDNVKLTEEQMIELFERVALYSGKITTT